MFIAAAAALSTKFTENHRLAGPLLCRRSLHFVASTTIDSSLFITHSSEHFQIYKSFVVISNTVVDGNTSAAGVQPAKLHAINR